MAKTLTFTPLHPTFGAECHGVDFSQPVPSATIQEIRNAMAKYGVLVFRGTSLTDETHTTFAQQFGEIDTSSALKKPGTAYRLGRDSLLVDVGNLTNTGEIEKPGSVRSQMVKGNGLFHTDCSYNSRRAGYSLLRAVVLPPKGTGGGTSFADTRTAYEELDSGVKEQIQDHVMWFSLLYSRRLAAPRYWLFILLTFRMSRLAGPIALALVLRFGVLPWLMDAIVAVLVTFIVVRFTLSKTWSPFATARHRLVQLHEPSGRMNLYISAHACRIDGWTREASKPVIDMLRRHAGQDKYTFTVDWENNGDLVMWDNTCVMHRACGGSYQGKYVRDMRRATIYDDSSSAWGLNR